MDKVSQNDCHFCSPGRNQFSANICLPIQVCDSCVTRIEFVLSTPAVKCPCGMGRKLIAFQFDGIRQAVCECHLPLNLAAKLAKDLTNNFGYLNAPSFYGSKENFDLIKQLGSNYIISLNEETEVGVNALVQVLSGINKIDEIVNY